MESRRLNKKKRKRILLKLSGEFLGNDEGIGVSADKFYEISLEIKKLLKENIEIGIVIGAGNLFRGGISRQSKNHTKLFRQINADKAGMFGTLMNSILLYDMLNQLQVKSILFSTIFIDSIEFFNPNKAIEYLQKGFVTIFGGGTSNPFFTTDTAAVLKAIEINADLLLKATRVDGVYDKDPEKYSDARLYKKITYLEAIEKKLHIMDLTAFSMAMENNLKIVVFNFFKKNSLLNIIKGKKIGTLIEG